VSLICRIVGHAPGKWTPGFVEWRKGVRERMGAVLPESICGRCLAKIVKVGPVTKWRGNYVEVETEEERDE